MKRISIAGLFLFFFGIASFSHGKSPAPILPTLKPQKPPATKGLFSTAAYEQKTLNRLNYHRALAGLNTLSLDTNLMMPRKGWILS
jgi:hypothetical protein